MTVEDQAFLAITSWKENREAGVPGLQSIINVIMNRAKMRNTSPFTECVRPLQFSSLTAHGDPELTVWPTEGHAADWEAWQQALALAAQAASGVLGDITDGADLYYEPASLPSGHSTIELPNGEVIPFPAGWNQNSVIYTCTIGTQVFFR